MRKQLLAFLSVLGLASSVTPGTAQVIKGADSPAAKAEAHNQNSTNKSLLVGLSQPSDAAKKMRKAGGEQQLRGDAYFKKQKKGAAESFAAGEGVRDKRNKFALENDAAGKQQAAKLRNSQMGDGSVVNASKNVNESNSLQAENWVKGGKMAANTSSTHSEARKQFDKASPK